MTAGTPETGQELRSLVTPEGTLQLSLVEVPVVLPQADQVLIRVEASPINPSDLGLLLAGADMASAQVSVTSGQPMVTASLVEGSMRSLAGRVGTSMPVGNEGAGTVIAAGESAAAQALLGKTVAVAAGAMYTQFRCVNAAQCLALPDGTPASVGASSFVNPLTALGMVETMRREGHSALVHTAAASNLGQMLNRLCLEEGVALVNIVRKPEQEEILRALGARYVCNSSSPSFMTELIAALAETSATLAFDAIGGGKLAGQILSAMEAASLTTSPAYSRYGSTTHKQVYIYGGLDPSPTVLKRGFGMAWGLGGWLLTPFLQSIDPALFQSLRDRVASGLTTTFASHYTEEVSLAEALQPEAFTVYAKQATGEKYLIAPHKVPT
ncbi:MAG: zinc-binding dehydrogenase [Acidimicrobiales bacterium]|jgi:NADPH:quinone reductase-like Zn-dependent oxidoreductase